jgi:hypothetical protein
MRIVERPIDLDLAETLARRAMPSRSVGRIHVSEVLRWIDNRVIHQGQRKAYTELSQSERRRMGAYTAMGWVWEDLIGTSLAPMFGGDIIKPGEVELDGIAGNPDGLELTRSAIDETKATWRSSRRPIETDFWSWMCQIKAYCHMLRLREAMLRVFFVNGDYRDSGPQIKAWDIEFTERELEDNWKMIVNNAKAMERERE